MRRKYPFDELNNKRLKLDSSVVDRSIQSFNVRKRKLSDQLCDQLINHDDDQLDQLVVHVKKCKISPSTRPTIDLKMKLNPFLDPGTLNTLLERLPINLLFKMRLSIYLTKHIDSFVNSICSRRLVPWVLPMVLKKISTKRKILMLYLTTFTFRQLNSIKFNYSNPPTILDLLDAYQRFKKTSINKM